MKPPLHVCIVGCGRMGVSHARALRRMYSPRRVRLSFASMRRGVAEELCKLYDGWHVFSGPDAYVHGCTWSTVDAVLIATPPSLHLGCAFMAAQAGHALLIEKPVTCTMPELSELRRIVNEHGVLCMVAENYHFKPIVRAVRRYINGGDIGVPLIFELHRTRRETFTGWRTDPKEMAMGALWEGGCHWVNMLTNLGGPIRKVCALTPLFESPGHGLDCPIGYPDTDVVLAQFENGAVGKLLYSAHLPNALHGASVCTVRGSQGMLIFEGNGAGVLVWGRRKRVRVLPGLSDITGQRTMLRSFVRSLEDDRVPVDYDLRRVQQDMAVIDAVRSARCGMTWQYVG